ncbi:MAG: hypothetical protein KME15_26470 [Drouetiella hepatica Uher 2000/2452]|jgi:hypothetical protein|uniref:Uncharacterized protein n=1 Tax=Drouetiella hepatica Uher 2000/2452 TaxID=904376 RepID=A0A951US65_9CYAN|nr:hypothetical protein [Drouetiella hepatica Uher 2000/2452]
MKHIDSARSSGQFSDIDIQPHPEIKKTNHSPDQPGFALKLAFQEHSMELSAQGTVVALSLVMLLGIGLFGVWQHIQTVSGAAQATQTYK